MVLKAQKGRRFITLCILVTGVGGARLSCYNHVYPVASFAFLRLKFRRLAGSLFGASERILVLGLGAGILELAKITQLFGGLMVFVPWRCSYVMLDVDPGSRR